jgi:hypothetical protein
LTLPHGPLIEELRDGLDVALDALPLEPLQRTFGVAMDAADFSDLQQVRASDKEGVNRCE